MDSTGRAFASMLARMGWLLRLGFSILMLFVATPFAAMFAEPFFTAILAQFGIDTSQWAGGAVTFVVDLAGAEWFRILSAIVFGVGLGVWAHYLATKFDRWRRGTEARPDIPVSRMTAVIGKVFVEEGVFLDGKRFVNCAFRNCTLHYNGVDFKLENPRFEGRTMLSSADKGFWYAGLLFEMTGMLKQNSVVGAIMQPRPLDDAVATAGEPLFGPPPFVWKEVRSATLHNQTLVLDGTRYIDCVFGDNCTFVYDGSPTAFVNCRRDGGKIAFSTNNPSIRMTFDFMRHFIYGYGPVEDVTFIELPNTNGGSLQGR